MKVGMTYDLRKDYLLRGFSEEAVAEYDNEDTIIAINNALLELGHEVERIGGLGELVTLLPTGKRVDIVFNICEGMFGFGREAQVPAVLDAYNIPYTFSDTSVLAVALNKGLTKRVARDLGVATPEFMLVACEEDLHHIDLAFPLFVKPVAEGTGKGIGSESKIVDLKALKKNAGELLEKYKQPVLVEEYLPGREFTTGIVGTGEKARVVGSMEIIFKGAHAGGIYSYQTKRDYEEMVFYRKVEMRDQEILADNALKIWNGLGCRDGGRIDFRMNKDGEVNFMEINPLAGLNPDHSDLPIICRLHGIPYLELIRMIMTSALERINYE